MESSNNWQYKAGKEYQYRIHGRKKVLRVGSYFSRDELEFIIDSVERRVQESPTT